MRARTAATRVAQGRLRRRGLDGGHRAQAALRRRQAVRGARGVEGDGAVGLVERAHQAVELAEAALEALAARACSDGEASRPLRSASHCFDAQRAPAGAPVVERVGDALPHLGAVGLAERGERRGERAATRRAPGGVERVGGVHAGARGERRPRAARRKAAAAMSTTSAAPSDDAAAARAARGVERDEELVASSPSARAGSARQAAQEGGLRGAPPGASGPAASAA